MYTPPSTLTTTLPLTSQTSPLTTSPPQTSQVHTVCHVRQMLLHPIIGRLQTAWWWAAVSSSAVHLASALFAWRDLVSIVCCWFWWTLSVLAVQVSILLLVLGTSMMLYFFCGLHSRLNCSFLIEIVWVAFG
ncbi:hypothetical protein EDC04DRAFT_2613372 [Pisolithus marmoratus]|nr:hypothetical protein EDC04DRAFT_2613372 [Pisolithus marmoratus]